jgi:hypothetical protein
MILKFFTTPRVAFVIEIDIGLRGSTIKSTRKGYAVLYTVRIGFLDHEPMYTMSDRARILRQSYVRRQ